MPDSLFLYIPLGVIALLVTVAAILKARAKAGDEGPDSEPYGDVIHVPVGMTPRSLVEHSHGDLVPQEGKRDHG